MIGRFLILAAVGFSLSACSALKPLGDAVYEGAMDGLYGKRDAVGGAYTRISDTKLKRIFDKFPIADDVNQPEWPKVAITITDYPEKLALSSANKKIGEEIKAKSTDCVSFSVVLWSNAKTKEEFKDLKMCPPDMEKDDRYRTLSLSGDMQGAAYERGKTTGQVRTKGPVPPSQVYPYPANLYQNDLINGIGNYYLQNIMRQLGYEWNYSQNHIRLWFVSVNRKIG